MMNLAVPHVVTVSNVAMLNVICRDERGRLDGDNDADWNENCFDRAWRGSYCVPAVAMIAAFLWKTLGKGTSEDCGR